MTKEEEQVFNVGLVAIETLKEILDILKIPRENIMTGTQIIEAVKAKVTSLGG